MTEGRAELLDDLSTTPSALPAEPPVGSTVGSPAGADPPGDGWSRTVVIGHLLHVEREVWAPRLEAMLTGAVPRWDLWEPDGVDWVGRYGDADPAELRTRFRDARRHTVVRLRGLDDEQWQRRAWHATFGDLDVAGLMRQALRHDREHLRQVAVPPA